MRLPHRSIHAVICCVGLVTTALLTACHTPPDMKPFSDASAQLSSAIKASGRAVGDEITLVTSSWPNDAKGKQQKQAAQAIKTRFTEHWAQRGKLADALTDYSTSLAAIVEAGNKGQQSAEALAKSFGTLCDSVGVALPPAIAGDVVAKAAAKVYRMFVRDKAAVTLGEGMVKMQPSLDEVVVVLQKDLDAIADALDTLRQEVRPAWYDRPVDGVLARTERDSITRSAKQQSELRALLYWQSDELSTRYTQAAIADSTAANKLAQSPNDAELIKAAKAASERHQAVKKEFDAVETSQASVLRTLAGLDATNASTAKRLAPIEAEITEAQDRIGAEIRLVNAARNGLSNWASTHARLAQAALESRAPSVEELVQASIEIRDLIKEIKSAKK